VSTERLARRRAAQRAARPPCGGRKARRHARQLATRAGEGRLGHAGALSTAVLDGGASLEKGERAAPARVRWAVGVGAAVGKPREALTTGRSPPKKAAAAEPDHGRAGRTNLSGAQRTSRDHVTVAVWAHAHVRETSRFEAGGGGATWEEDSWRTPADSCVVPFRFFLAPKIAYLGT